MPDADHRPLLAAGTAVFGLAFEELLPGDDSDLLPAADDGVRCPQTFAAGVECHFFGGVGQGFGKDWDPCVAFFFCRQW